MFHWMFLAAGLLAGMGLFLFVFTRAVSRSAARRGSAIDQVVRANRAYARDFAQRGLPARPARRLAVLACMDCRIRVEATLGLVTGEAHVLRNAGGIVTEDVLRSLILSHHLLGTEEILVVQHTECACQKLEDETFRASLVRRTGKTASEPACFHPFRDLAHSVREQIRRVRSHPWIPSSVKVRGCIYDVKTGALTEVAQIA